MMVLCAHGDYQDIVDEICIIGEAFNSNWLTKITRYKRFLILVFVRIENKR